MKCLLNRYNFLINFNLNIVGFVNFVKFDNKLNVVIIMFCCIFF